jgi:3-deoxy-D-manno-octulosonic-acid transferase
MMLFLYDVILFLALLVASPFLIPKVLLGGHGLKERLGFWPREYFTDTEASPVLWIHAASVGEVHSLAAFLPALKKTARGYRWILSVTTRAGRDRAAQIHDEIDRIFYLPIDLSFVIKRVLRLVDPKILLLTETELWPNLIIQARRRGIKVALINGRMSRRSHSRYRLIKNLLAQTLASMDLLCIQTEQDAQRFKTLGAEASKIAVTGNFKGDLLAVPQMRGERMRMRSLLGIQQRDRVLVAGSTRPGEEEQIAQAIVHLQRKKVPLRAIVAPRHVKRTKSVSRILEEQGLIVQRFSQIEEPLPMAWNVIVVDTLGQLLHLYSAADVAFVGGSLLPYGGHNPLEPASYGIPVLFGPHMDHCRRSAQLLLQTGGGMEVKDGKELRDVAARLFQSAQESAQRGGAALEVVKSEMGSVDRTVQALREAVL